MGVKGTFPIMDRTNVLSTLFQTLLLAKNRSSNSQGRTQPDGLTPDFRGPRSCRLSLVLAIPHISKTNSGKTAFFRPKFDLVSKGLWSWRSRDIFTMAPGEVWNLPDVADWSALAKFYTLSQWQQTFVVGYLGTGARYPIRLKTLKNADFVI